MDWYNQKSKGSGQLLPSTLTLTLLGVLISTAPLPPTASSRSLTRNSTSLQTQLSTTMLSSKTSSSSPTSAPPPSQSSPAPLIYTTFTTIHPPSNTTAFTLSKTTRSRLPDTSRFLTHTYRRLPKTTVTRLPKISPNSLLKPALPHLPRTTFSPITQSLSPPLSQPSPAPPLLLIAHTQIKTSRLRLPRTISQPLPKIPHPHQPETSLYQSSPASLLLSITHSPVVHPTSTSVPETSTPPLPYTFPHLLRSPPSPLPHIAYPLPKTSTAHYHKTTTPPLTLSSTDLLINTSSPTVPPISTTSNPENKTSPQYLPKIFVIHQPKSSRHPPLKTTVPPPHTSSASHSQSTLTPLSSSRPTTATSCFTSTIPPFLSTSPRPPPRSNGTRPKTSPNCPSKASRSYHPKSTIAPFPKSIGTFFSLSSPAAPFYITSTTVHPVSGRAIAPLPPNTRPLPKSTSPHTPKASPPPLPHTAPPLFHNEPFIVSWNIPDLVCNRYNISLDTSPYRGVATPAKVPGQFLSLFYTDRLGLYPRVDLPSRQQFYGGIPQRGNLRASLAKAHADINYYIPSRTARGLAVIDWEDWRPLWTRNWGPKFIYRTLSLAHARYRDSSLIAQQATAAAKEHFQAAARSYMAETLSLGARLRPNYLWGFYLFPNCYNYGWTEPGYTGRCSREVMEQNDQLLWLWEASSALYPSIYLQASLGDRHSAALLSRNRVQEALRVSALPARPVTAPIYVYTRPVFIDQNRRFLSLGDLVNTIGESAAVGASGAVLWGASADYNDKGSCEALSSYLATTLNPYVANVTTAAQLCSDFLCQGNGRCVRKHYESDHYLHLSSENFRIVRARGRYMALGMLSLADLTTFARGFTCQCYTGQTCHPKLPTQLSKALLFRLKKHLGLSNKTKTLHKVTADMEQSTVE